MKAKLANLLILCAFSLLISGCASTNGYLGDRKRDALDVFTAGIGMGLGGKMRIGPAQTGLLFEMTGASLRGGEFTTAGKAGTGADGWGNCTDVMGIIYGGEFFHGAVLDRNKNFDADNLTVFSETGEQVFALPFIYAPEHGIDYWYRYAPEGKQAFYYYSQIEVVAALGLSVRLGFNLGELLDFLLGWTGLDIYEDDLGTKKKVEQGVAGYPPQGVGSPER